VPFTSERQPVRIALAAPDRLRLCRDTIARRDFRLRYADGVAYEVRCADNEWMLLLTEDAVRDAASLGTRRSIAAAVALFIAESGSFSIAMIALVETGGRLVVCRSTGEALFAGALRERGGTAFSIQALTRPGAFPLLVEGSMTSGTLAIGEAAMGPVAIPKRRPVPLDLAAP
jgi:hypothetical protein